MKKDESIIPPLDIFSYYTTLIISFIALFIYENKSFTFQSIYWALAFLVVAAFLQYRFNMSFLKSPIQVILGYIYAAVIMAIILTLKG